MQWIKGAPVVSGDYVIHAHGLTDVAVVNVEESWFHVADIARPLSHWPSDTWRSPAPLKVPGLVDVLRVDLPTYAVPRRAMPLPPVIDDDIATWFTTRASASLAPDTSLADAMRQLSRFMMVIAEIPVWRELTIQSLEWPDPHTDQAYGDASRFAARELRRLYALEARLALEARQRRDSEPW